MVRSLVEVIQHSTGYVRLYEGDWTDRGTKEETIRKFYDEREWRAIGSAGEFLKFTISDLSHVFVDTESERDDLIDFAVNKCPMLSIANRDDIVRKVRTFDESFGEA